MKSELFEPGKLWKITGNTQSIAKSTTHVFPPKTYMFPENQWLEYPFLEDMLVFRGVFPKSMRIQETNFSI